MRRRQKQNKRQTRKKTKKKKKRKTRKKKKYLRARIFYGTTETHEDDGERRHRSQALACWPPASFLFSFLLLLFSLGEISKREA